MSKRNLLKIFPEWGCVYVLVRCVCSTFALLAASRSSRSWSRSRLLEPRGVACLLARLQGAPHNTAYACSRPSLEVKQLFICLILWVAENVISLYICTQILTICAAVRATNQSEVNENFTWYNSIHNAFALYFCRMPRPAAPYYSYYYVLCGPWSVARSWHYLCHTAWLMLKLFFIIWQPVDDSTDCSGAADSYLYLVIRFFFYIN